MSRFNLNPFANVYKTSVSAAANEILGVVAFLGGPCCSSIAMITEGDQIKARSVFGIATSLPALLLISLKS